MHSQEKVWTGSVLDAKGTPVQFATVTLSNADTVYLCGTISDSLGDFRLSNEYVF